MPTFDLEHESLDGSVSDSGHSRSSLCGTIVRPCCMDLRLSWNVATQKGLHMTQGATT